MVSGGGSCVFVTIHFAILFLICSFLLGINLLTFTEDYFRALS